MAKKFIIENHKDSQTFSILVIKETRSNRGYLELGFLSYFKVDDDGMVHEWEVVDDAPQSFKEISAEFIEKAEKICKENNVRLWGY